jgi:hypothetical protein
MSDSARTLMHFDDGVTLTENDVYPHELEKERAEHLTSIERVIKGRHLTILKSPLINDFFIITDAYRDWSFTSGEAGSGDITLRSVGCHLKNSDPLTRLKLSMDPRTFNVILHIEWVKSYDPRGFAPPLAPSHPIKDNVTLNLDDSSWSIVKEPPVRRVWGTGKGLACLFAINDSSRGVAELRLNKSNVQLLISPEQ